MHPEAFEFLSKTRDEHPEFFVKRNVLDVGSGDINGNTRPLFKECVIIGNDVAPGPNVDIISPTHLLPFPDSFFDTIISSECFEHDPFWKDSMAKIARMLKPGGFFTFTCASTGRPEHGTRRTTPEVTLSSRNHVENMQDYYMNLTIDDVRQAIDLDTVFSEWKSFYNPVSCDLYFWGIKR